MALPASLPPLCLPTFHQALSQTWMAAESTCQAQGGNLPSVHNLAEWINLRSIIMHMTYPTTVSQL